jgi:hypothetical protein
VGVLIDDRKKVGPPEENRGGIGGNQDDLVRRFVRDYARSKNAFAKRREIWKKYFRAYAEDPFDPGVKEAMAEQDRVMATFNYCLSTINTLIGQDQADRKEARFEGVDGDTSDTFTGELFTDLIRHLYQKAKGHRKESDAQLDQLLSGYGWLEVYMDSTSFPFSLKVRHVDVFDVYPDPNYKEANCLDGRYVIVTEKWSLEDAIARWPKHADRLQSAQAQSSDSGTPFPKKSRGDALGYGPGPQDTHYADSQDEPRISVSDYQYRKLAPWVAFTDPTTGKSSELPKKDFDNLLEQLSQIEDPITGSTAADKVGEAVEFQREEIYRVWLAGLEGASAFILEGPKRIEDTMFTHRCATGYRARDGETGLTYHFGLMALIYEPQLWSSKTLSTIIDFLSIQAKGGGFFRPSALLDPVGFQDGGATLGKWHALADGADPKLDIIPNAPMQWPTAMEKLMDIAMRAPQLTANISEYDKGTAVSERSNVLISNLQQHSQMVLNPLMDPLSEMRVGVALLFAKFAQRYVPASTMDRILGGKKCEGVTFEYETDPSGLQKIEVPILIQDPESQGDPAAMPPIPAGMRPTRPSDIIKKADVTDFDVAIDLGSASVTSKQAFMQTMMQTAFGKTLAELGVLDRFLPLMVKNWPGIPANDAKKLSKELEADAQARRAQQNAGAILEAIQVMPPDQQMALAQQLAPLFQQMAAQQQQQQAGAPPQGEAPPAQPQQGGGNPQ